MMSWIEVKVGTEGAFVAFASLVGAEVDELVCKAIGLREGDSLVGFVVGVAFAAGVGGGFVPGAGVDTTEASAAGLSGTEASLGPIEGLGVGAREGESDGKFDGLGVGSLLDG